jgi:hypothetical protein
VPLASLVRGASTTNSHLPAFGSNRALEPASGGRGNAPDVDKEPAEQASTISLAVETARGRLDGAERVTRHAKSRHAVTFAGNR